MAVNSKLDELKKQVRETSKQQLQIQDRRTKAKELATYREQEQEQNEQEMVQFVRSIFGQSELAAAKERELLQDKLDRFSYRQTLMNEQLITLNDNLADITSLKAIYEAKREVMELDFQNQKETLLKQIKTLNSRLDYQKEELESLNEEISIKTSKLEEINAETKKATFWMEFKKTWIDKWLVYVIVGFIAMIIGGFAGWSIFTLVGSILSAIGKFFGSMIV